MLRPASGSNGILSVDGRMRPDLEPVFHALLQQQPVSLLAWLTRRPGRATILRALAAGHGPVTHNTLDQLRPPKGVENLRRSTVPAPTSRR